MSERSVLRTGRFDGSVSTYILCMLRIIMKRESSTKNLLLLATLICGSYGTLEPMTSVAQPLEFKD